MAAEARATPASFDFDLRAQPLAAALQAVGRTSGENVLVQTPLVAGRQAAPLRGRFTVEEALERLLAGSRLQPRRADDRSVFIEPEPPRRAAATRPMVLAQASAGSKVLSDGRGPGLAAAPAAPDDGGIQEIVVTAEKRETTIQHTPVAVAAISQDSLTREGVTQLSAMSKVVPDVKITPTGAGQWVSIRGVYTSDQSPTQEAAVAVHVDGAYLAKTTALEGFLYDLQRVEVAKGPQGTLYGRNANGGTINIITNKAVIGESSAAAEVEVGNYSLFRATGDVNVPLGETLAVRAAFQTLSHSGYMKSGLNDASQQGGRVSLRWTPSDRDSLWITADYTHIGGRGNGGSNVIDSKSTGRYYVPADPRDDTFYNADPGSFDADHRTKAEVFRRDSTNKGLTAQNDLDLGFATWTTEIAYRKFESDPVIPGSLGLGSPVEIPGVGTFPQGGRSATPAHFESESVETRLTSTSTQTLAWVVGVYGFRDVDGGTNIQYPNHTATTPSNQFANTYEEALSGAIFGQATYTPPSLDRLHITLGGRYTLDKKRTSGIFTQIAAILPYAFGPRAYSNHWNAFTYKAGLAYDVTARSLLYANYSTGYKAGGYAYGPGTNAALGPLLAPETIKAVEVGSKNRFLDNRLQLNLEAFLYTYRNFEVGFSVLPVGSTSAVGTAASAGGAKYKGFDADLQFLLTAADTIRANFSEVSGRYGAFSLAAPAGFTLVGVPNLTGTPIPAVPQWTGMASFAHTLQVWNGSLNGEVYATFRGPINLISPANDPVYGRVNVRGHAFSTVNLSLKYQPSRGPWTLTGYVNNLSDGAHAVHATYSTTTHLTTGWLSDPRTVGVIFSARLP